MFLFIHGENRVPIGYDELYIKCQACEEHTLSEVMVFSKYYHFYWMPISPFAKEAHILCTKCGMRRFGVPFDKDIIPHYEEVKDKFHHPWYTYIVIAIALICVLSIIIIAITE